MNEKHVEGKRGRMKKLNCLLIQKKENSRLIYTEKTRLGEAEYHHPSPKPTTSAGARPPPQHGGRRGPWGLEATERHRSHRAKSDGNKASSTEQYNVIRQKREFLRIN